MKRSHTPLLLSGALCASLLGGCSIDSLFSLLLSDASERQCAIYGPTSEGDDIVSASFGTLHYLEYENLTEVPYLPFQTAMDIVANLYGYEENISKFSSTLFNDVLTYKNGDASLTIDADEDTVSFNDYDLFLYDVSGGGTTSAGVYGPIVSLGRSAYIEESKINITPGNGITFDLSEYGIDITCLHGDVCLPLPVLSDIFFAPLGYPIAFDGEDMQVANYSVLSHDSFAEDYYDSVYAGESLSENFASFNYALTCFEVDYFYGYPSENGQHTHTSLDEYLQKNDPLLRAKLKSTNPDVNASAFAQLLLNELGDGHTGCYKGYGSFYSKTFEGASSASTRLMEMSAAEKELSELNAKGDRPEDGLYYDGNTAIIKFSSFDSVDENITSANVSRYAEDDSFAFVYQAFKSIGKKGGIQNVVFDLSMNEGGYVNALIAVLGFLSEEVTLCLENPLTGARVEQVYRVDTDLDGSFDDFSELPYDFYTLTSSCSFSCANAFPCVFQNAGMGQVIGEQSGGGSCVVYSNLSAAGQPYQMSGLSRISLKDDADGSFQSVDEGVTPDIALSRSLLFDNDAIVSAIN